MQPTVPPSSPATPPDQPGPLNPAPAYVPWEVPDPNAIWVSFLHGKHLESLFWTDVHRASMDLDLNRLRIWTPMVVVEIVGTMVVQLHDDLKIRQVNMVASDEAGLIRSIRFLSRQEAEAEERHAQEQEQVETRLDAILAGRMSEPDEETEAHPNGDHDGQGHLTPDAP